MAKNSPTHQVGDLINLRYEIVGVLGSGGMSSVYKVKDSNLDGQLIALKLLDPVLLRDVNNIERFKREAIVARRLDHPNIVRVFDFDVTDTGEYFLTMEYIEGSTLSERLKNTANPLTIPQLTAVLYEIASALEHAHKHGVVHRDLKPANVLLNKDGKVKIADFGLCRATCFDEALSVSGECLGTPAYMSPEQIRGEDIDGRSDIYSLGMLAFEACEGRPPFKADTWFKVAEMHLRSPLPKLSPNFPDWYREMVERCAAKAPDERYDSARQLLELLEEHLAQSANKPRKKKNPDYSQYMGGAFAASCILAVLATIGIAGAKFLTEEDIKHPPKHISVASNHVQPKHAHKAEHSLEHKPTHEAPEQELMEQPERRGPFSRLKEMRQQFEQRQMREGGGNFAGEYDPRQERGFKEQREQREPRDYRNDRDSKPAKYICTRAGRTIETEEIPEGKNWECRMAGQMNQMGGMNPPPQNQMGQGPMGQMGQMDNRPMMPQQKRLRPRFK